MFFVAVGALSLGACSEGTTEEETVNEEVKVRMYTLDAENSTLGWLGMISSDYNHSGTVNFTSGSVTMENGELTDGSFVVDMTTINDTSMAEPKSGYLTGHLQGTVVDDDHPQNMFFNTPEFPTVEVKLGEYKDGNLSTKLMILGSELTQEVPVEISSSENGASIKGKFTMDFTSLGIPGLSGEGEGAISPKIDFDLNLILTE